MKVRIEESKNIAYIKMTGKVSSKDILDTFDIVVSSEKYKKGMGRLWDFTDVDVSSLDSHVMPQMAQYSLSFPPGIRDVKVAFIATKTNVYGLARMFQAYSDIYAKTQVKIFDTIEKAEQWITEKK